MVLGRKVVTPSSVTPSDVAAIRNAKRPAHPSQNSRASFTFGDTDQFTSLGQALNDRSRLRII